jgi:hypothetical protein
MIPKIMIHHYFMRFPGSQNITAIGIGKECRYPHGGLKWSASQRQNAEEIPSGGNLE